MLKFVRGGGLSLEGGFAFIYTREAHASDKWPMKWAVEWPEPRTLDERILRAKRCDEDLGWSPDVQMFVDDMDDLFCHSFGAWPAGCYVIDSKGRLLFVCAPPRQEVFLDMDDLFGYLRQFANVATPCAS